MARKHGCRGIAEIANLWPESIVAYGIAGSQDPAVIALRWLEKWIYKKSDAIVFTMEGAYDYILEQGWEKEIPREKVHYINNGVDVELFQYNKENSVKVSTGPAQSKKGRTRVPLQTTGFAR